MNKINKVIKYKDLPVEAMEALEDKYPEEWQDHVRKITKSNGDSFYAINVDTPKVSYLIKVDVKVDSSGEMEILDDQIIDKKAEKAAESHSRDDGDLEGEDVDE